jgi:replication factor C subunit 3/5
MKYEHRLRQGSKPIFHIEAFIAKFMCIYQQHIQALAASLDEDFD